MKLIHKNRLLCLAIQLSRKKCTIYHDSNIFRKCTDVIFKLAREEGQPIITWPNSEPLFSYEGSDAGHKDRRWGLLWGYLGITQEQFDNLFLSSKYQYPSRQWDIGSIDRGPRSEFHPAAFYLQWEAVYRILDFIVENGEKSAE